MYANIILHVAVKYKNGRTIGYKMFIEGPGDFGEQVPKLVKDIGRALGRKSSPRVVLMTIRSAVLAHHGAIDASKIDVVYTVKERETAINNIKSRTGANLDNMIRDNTWKDFKYFPNEVLINMVKQPFRRKEFENDLRRYLEYVYAEAGGRLG